MQALFLQVYVDVKRPPFEIGPDNAWQVLDFAIKIICLCTFNQTAFSSFYHFFSQSYNASSADYIYFCVGYLETVTATLSL